MWYMVITHGKTRVFNSGLGTTGPHCIISPSVTFSWCWGTNIYKDKYCALYFGLNRFWGVALLEITVHRQNEP